MKKILFIQLPPPRFDFCEAPLNIPLAAGFITSALGVSADGVFERAGSLHVEIMDHTITDILGDQGLISAIRKFSPDVICMTLYVWNVQRSLFIASMVRRELPDATILVGGPEVTKDNDWVLRHPAVSAGVFGEGESRISCVLGRLTANLSIEDVPGTFSRVAGEVIINDTVPDPWKMDLCPYPYLNGTLDTEYYQTAFVETARGCPFKCKYCFYHKSFAKVRFHSPDRLKHLFDFLYSDSCAVSEIYLMDPTFNARPDFRKILAVLTCLRERKSIRLHTELRSDLLSDQDIDLFVDSGLVSAEIGLQSTNPVALELASRSGDPEKVMRGALRLKEKGIEVTTGIILGLPGDSPQGFSKTMRDLKNSQGYSVVHPFVLSVLPGTDFRIEAQHLGLKYYNRPPYHVYETDNFPKESLRDCLLEFESEFETELDHINPPSLVCDKELSIGCIEEAQYVSKWIVNSGTMIEERMVRMVCSKSTDPFTFWFRGELASGSMNWAARLLRIFCDENPYTSVHIVFENDSYPQINAIREVIDVAAQTGLYLNSYYHPLYREDEIISPVLWILIPDPGSVTKRTELMETYAPFGKIIWKIDGFESCEPLNTWTPLLINQEMKASPRLISSVFKMLKNIHEEYVEEVLFSQASYQNQWNSKIRRLNSKSRIVEKILMS